MAIGEKMENHKPAIALHFAYCNVCRVHLSPRATRAMEAGIASWDTRRIDFAVRH